MSNEMIEVQTGFTAHAKEDSTPQWFQKGTRMCLTGPVRLNREKCGNCPGSPMMDVPYYDFIFEDKNYSVKTKFAVVVSPGDPGTGPLPFNDQRVMAMSPHIPGDGYDPNARLAEFNAMGVIDIRYPNKVFTPEEALALRKK